MDRIGASSPLVRPLSSYAREAAILLGQMIRRARLERRMTAAQLAERAGISRGLVQRVEKGDATCSIGAAFEAAAIVGVRLFDADRSELAAASSRNADILALLPKAARERTSEVIDDF